MANKTVYPYGTGGQLPSSIGIVNDLTTGGADKALAAEQGKIIGDYLGDNISGVKYVDLDLSLYETQDYGLGAASSSSNRWTTSGKHKTIPVVPGEVYKLTVTSTQASGGFYGFFTSQFVEPTSTSSAIPYANGESRKWMNNGDKEVTVPDGSAYLVICPRDGDGKNSSWTVGKQSPKTISDDFLGKDALDEELDEMMEYALNLDSYVPVRAFPAATNKWVCTDSSYPYYGYFVPCEPGQAFELIAKTNEDVVRYCFLQNNSYGQGDSVAYADGYSGSPAATPQGGASVTAPYNANYLYIYVSNDGLVTTFGPSSIRTTAKTVEEIAIAAAGTVEPGYSGDSEEKIPSGMTKYAYSGPLVKVAEKQHYVARAKVATITSVACQGGACYGDYLFLFTENNTTCWMYNLSTSQLIQTITIPSAERGFVSDCHSNTVNFGTEFYDAGDPFPLIYVSTGYNDGTYTGALVYRIVATTENDTTTYSLTLVQTLKFPKQPSAWTEFIVGDQGDCYVVYSSLMRIYRMSLPQLSDGDVIFDLNDAWGVYQFPPRPSSWNDSRAQNWMYHDGKIIFVSGVPASGEKSLFVVLDLATCKIGSVIDLQTLNLNSESETCFIWNGHFCVAFRNNANVYALYFE